MSALLNSLRHPIVLAPLGGGPSTPELAAAVSEAGGLGFLAAAYLPATELEVRLRRTRELTSAPIAVNVFCPGEGPSEPGAYAEYARRLRSFAEREGLELGEPRYSDDDWDAKLELLTRDPVPAVSFTFGCPEPALVERLQAAGSEVWVTVTSPEEAREAQEAGADALVVQGAEAGGHRGSFRDRPDLPLYGLLALLGLLRADSALPLVAAGGIATGEAVAAALAAGAAAAALGTAFMLAPEAGTSAPHRQELSRPSPTVLTRAFSGRLARAIPNRFLAEHDAGAPVAYPEVHYLTAPMRARAREQGDPELINLWAGEAHALARPEPAREIVLRLAAETRQAAQRAAQAAGASAPRPSSASDPRSTSSENR
jgi:nitronate monooxygenase